MRIWHKDLIRVLPTKLLKTQWRDMHLIMSNIARNCKPGSVIVNRIVDYPIEQTWRYICLVGQELSRRGYKTKSNIGKYFSMDDIRRQKKIFGYDIMLAAGQLSVEEIFYKWHDNQYLIQCFYMLQERYDCGDITDEEYEEIRRFMLERGIRV